MTPPLLATVTAALEAHDSDSASVVDALIAQDSVATVFVSGARCVYRVDVPSAATAEQAGAEALRPLAAVRSQLGTGYRIVSVVVERHDPTVPVTQRRAVWRSSDGLESNP